MTRNHSRAGLLLALTGLALLALPAVSDKTLKPITSLVAGSGLTGGGTGPTATVAIGAGKVTSAHVADGTLGLADFARETREGLRGPQGPPGEARPSLVFSRTLAHDWVAPNPPLPGGNPVIEELTAAFTLAEPKVLRVCANVGTATLQVLVNGAVVAHRTSPASRIMVLPPGRYTVEVAVVVGPGVTIRAQPYPVYLDVELE